MHTISDNLTGEYEMDRGTFQDMLRTKTFRIFLFLLFLYAWMMVFFLLVIRPAPNKVPLESPATWLRDVIWIIGWRFNLDYEIICAFVCLVALETEIYSKAIQKSKDPAKLTDRLSLFVSPAVNFGFSYLYMLAIDLGVTYMGDTTINGTWNSPQVIWLGFTAAELYHNFFFWFVPAVIICSIVNQVFFRTRSWAKVFQAFCACMAVYSLNLGFLDPVVCQILWGNWRLFGDWAMGGADAIWAGGWIAHYVIFATFWLAGIKFIKRIQRESMELRSLSKI